MRLGRRKRNFRTRFRRKLENFGEFSILGRGFQFWVAYMGGSSALTRPPWGGYPTPSPTPSLAYPTPTHQRTQPQASLSLSSSKPSSSRPLAAHSTTRTALESRPQSPKPFTPPCTQPSTPNQTLRAPRIPSQAP